MPSEAVPCGFSVPFEKNQPWEDSDCSSTCSFQNEILQMQAPGSLLLDFRNGKVEHHLYKAAERALHVDWELRWPFFLSGAPLPFGWRCWAYWPPYRVSFSYRCTSVLFLLSWPSTVEFCRHKTLFASIIHELWSGFHAICEGYCYAAEIYKIGSSAQPIKNYHTALLQWILELDQDY